MKNSNKIYLLAALALFIYSCSPKTPFTQSIREQYKLGERELKSLQFYNSHDIVLNRAEKAESGQETTDGTLTIKTGRSLEQIFIKAGTPGIVEKVPGDNNLRVSFEVGEGTGIVFGASNRAQNERYTLMAPEWKNDRGKMQYKGKTYYTSRGSGDTYLQFKMKRLNKYIKKQRTVKGRKI